MTRVALARRDRRGAGRPAFADKVTGSWGTFLKPAANRGLLCFGPDDGRNVTFVKPAAWLGIDIPEPDGSAIAAVTERHLAAFPGASKPELARWWGMATGWLKAPAGRARRPAHARRRRGDEGLRPDGGPRACSPPRSRRPAAPDPGRVRPVHAVAPEGGRAAAAAGPPAAGLAHGRLDQRGGDRRRPGDRHLDARGGPEGRLDRDRALAHGSPGGPDAARRRGGAHRGLPRARIDAPR